MYDGQVEALFTGMPPGSALTRMKQNFQALLKSVPLAPGYIFERADGQDFCDISLRLSKSDGSLNYFMGQVATERKYERLKQSAVWRRVLLFLASHRNDNSRYFNDCWLEFDDSSLLSGMPVPSLFVNNVSLSEPALMQAFEQLAGNSLPFANAKNVLELARPGYLHFAGLMLARNGQAIRLCIKVRRDQTSRLLQNLAVKIHWLAGVDEVVLSIDVADDGILPRTGVEYPVAGGRSAIELYRQLSGGYGRWPEACWAKDSEQLAEALAKERISTQPRADAKWYFSRKVNHFKQVFEPGRPLELKTYSYLALGWRR